MTQPDILEATLKDSKHRLALFSAGEVNALRDKVFTKTGRERKYHT